MVTQSCKSAPEKKTLSTHKNVVSIQTRGKMECIIQALVAWNVPLAKYWQTEGWLP
jgi:hypothetical protein